MKMSPFMHAHEIKKPILLIHGEEDTNSGTNVIQSERFFAALKGNGADAETGAAAARIAQHSRARVRAARPGGDERLLGQAPRARTRLR